MAIKKIMSRAIIPMVGTLILFLFYRSRLVLFALPVLIVFSLKYSKQKESEKYREELMFQFKDSLVSMAAALRAGYSVERALVESYKEMVLMYSKDAPISRELMKINNQIGLGMNPEEALREFSDRSSLEDIETFVSVFSIAKHTGGDLVEIINKTASDISAKTDTMKEIHVLTSAKRLEQNLMAVMPPAIILYVDLTTDGMLDPLYGNLTGVVIMTICLILYVFAFILGRKLVKIEV